MSISTFLVDEHHWLGAFFGGEASAKLGNSTLGSSQRPPIFAKNWLGCLSSMPLQYVEDKTVHSLHWSCSVNGLHEAFWDTFDAAVCPGYLCTFEASAKGVSSAVGLGCRTCCKVRELFRYTWITWHTWHTSWHRHTHTHTHLILQTDRTSWTCHAQIISPVPPFAISFHLHSFAFHVCPLTPALSFETGSCSSKWEQIGLAFIVWQLGALWAHRCECIMRIMQHNAAAKNEKQTTWSFESLWSFLIWL